MKTVMTDDGLALLTQVWPASQRAPGTARGAVVLVHGLGEHVARYDHVARRLNGQGFNVVGYDHRGHGGSSGPRGRLHHPDDLLRDLALVVDKVRAAQPGTLVLLGHSLGGLIAARFVAEGLAAQPAPWHRPVDALVLSSPALDPGMNGVQKLLLALAGPFAPDLRVTPRLVRFILDAGAHVLAEAKRWSVPTLLMYAGSDRCVAPRGSAAFAAAAPKGVVQAREFRALYHEIFNEPEHAEVFAVLDAWLVQQAR
jgi:alpha-beta hydrolase superfamily lysophospholipase